MKTLNLIGISLLNVLTSKKLLLEVENVNDTYPGSDYIIEPEGDLGQRSVPQDMRLLQVVT